MDLGVFCSLGEFLSFERDLVGFEVSERDLELFADLSL